jgi:hypothetical protein
MPAPANPYPTIYTELAQESLDASAAFLNAQTELNTQAAPDVYFLELIYTGGKIFRAWDSAQVTSLAPAEQFRLLPQLGGLFNLAMRNLLNP